MKKRLRISLFILLGIVLCGLVFLALPPTEPSYKGRSISAWLDDFYADKKGETNRLDCVAAVEYVGTNCLPYVVARVARNDSKWRNKYKDLWNKSPDWLESILPQPKPDVQIEDAAFVFDFIGSNAIPQAIVLLKHKSPSVQDFAMDGLTYLAMSELRDDESRQTKQAVPALIETLNDRDDMIRCNAAVTLGAIGASASNAVPALTKIARNMATRGFLADGAREAAICALGNIGPAAKSALPTIKPALQVPNSYLRDKVAVAIWRIDSDVDTALPVLLQEMPTLNEHEKWDSIIELGEMGPLAKDAIPQLATELKQDDQSWVLQYVTNALIKIDPEAAAKLGVHPPPQKKPE